MKRRSCTNAICLLPVILLAVGLAGCVGMTGGFNDIVLQELTSVQDVREYQTTFGRMRIGFEGTTAKGVYEYRQGSVHGSLQGTVLSGSWHEGTASGTFSFTFSADFTSFRGYWTPGNNEWKGQLVLGRNGPPNAEAVASPRLSPPPSLFNSAMEKEMQNIGDVREYVTTFGRLRLGFDGMAVKGTYEYRQGMIRGSLQGTMISGMWQEGEAGGSFVFHFSPDFGSFSGTWQPDNKPWTGTLTAGNRGMPGIAVATPPVLAPAAQMQMSDVDNVTARQTQPNRNAYAIVIGIEQYRQKLPKADFAVSDAKLMSEYLTKAMGYPEENVITLLNDRALKSDFEKYFEKWLSNNVETDSTVFVYFSGHGAPEPKSGNAYLVPYDGDPSFIDQTGYSLKRMYDALGKLKAKEIIVVLDSCFSGAGGRSVLAKGARPLVMNLQDNIVPSKNMTVLSASSGKQVSSTYDEKGHGLFTYFMLKGIKNEDVVNKDGSLKMDDLFGYIKPQVERIARKQYNNEQTPQLMGAKRN